ncbi:hypothetical protein Rt10032_c01g0275 [Rhodotorula toruloides]|uniref:Uncharacterized protein n=1 Tax=Rhodotorula toruloides TaxID=5286 RepID=A0A511K7F2_RHOTO|nr:hypothetical protein Rt10032_c01g0275 [Rhodotorula toruloides]
MSQHAASSQSGAAAAYSAQSRIFHQAMAGRPGAGSAAAGGGAGSASNASSTSPTPSLASTAGTTSTLHSAQDSPHTTKTSSNGGKDEREKGWRWGPARMENGDEGGHA